LILLNVTTFRKGKKVDLKRLRALIEPNIVDRSHPRSDEHFSSITIRIQLAPGDRAKAFVHQYLEVMQPVIYKKSFRLR